MKTILVSEHDLPQTRDLREPGRRLRIKSQYDPDGFPVGAGQGQGKKGPRSLARGEGSRQEVPVKAHGSQQ